MTNLTPESQARMEKAWITSYGDEQSEAVPLSECLGDGHVADAFAEVWAARVEAEERQAHLRWLLERAEKYIGQHCPTEDLQTEICAVLTVSSTEKESDGS